MPKDDQDLDIELDPKGLDLKKMWKMAWKQQRAWLEVVKKEQKKLTKKWRPMGH